MQSIQHHLVLKLQQAEKNYRKINNTKMVIRIKCLIAYYKGKKVKDISTYFNVSSKTIRHWIKKYHDNNNIDQLLDGSRSGRPPKLNTKQLEALKEKINKDQERVWFARHIFQLIYTLYSVTYSIKYLPELLRKIGLSFHKAVHYLIKRNEEKRSEWIKDKLPLIYKDHIKQGWRIFYQDEVGFQTQGTLAYSWGAKGKEIVVKNKGRHGRVNLIGAYEVGSGEFFYKMTTQKVNALKFKRFLCCLKRKYRTDKFIVIADNASFHKAKWFTAWWENTSWLRLEFLPAYSPDFNPIERLWKWIKKEYTHNKCWSTQHALLLHLDNNLIKMTENKNQYIGTMKKELLNLKAAFDHYETEFIWDDQIPLAA